MMVTGRSPGRPVEGSAMIENEEQRRCADGHLMTQVRRANGFRTVCLTCLSAAMKTAQDRAATVTVNDLIHGMESGEMPRLNRSDGDGMVAMMLAAKELYGEQGLEECRKVLRMIASEKGVKIGAVMAMPAGKIAEELDALRACAV